MRTNIAAFLVCLASMPTMASAVLRGQARNKFALRATSCTTNSDCGSGNYCAAGQCLAMGTCQTEWDCRNPNNVYPVIECTGPLLCNENNQCGRECGPTCADGTNEVPCMVNPCSFAETFCDMEFTQCANDFCGGCKALVFNDTGNHEMCSLPGTLFIESQKNCTSSADCGESKYCSQGVCMEYGQCSSDADCFNADNVYAVIECVGPISCDKNSSQCSRECSDSDCPADKPPVECLVSTCATLNQTCQDDISSCVDYSCGDCGAFAFDKAGFQVCNEPTPKLCNSTRDCGDSEYCSQGVCTGAGACSSDADCFNPDNVFATVLCVGPVFCDLEKGLCDRTCSDSNCPTGESEVACLASTCATLADSCQDDIATCVDYNCGGCGAFAFDEAGHQVCKSCSSADDCADDEYCAGGKCLTDGKCGTDVDCFNPTNQYAVIMCVGVLSCGDGGMCGVQCGPSTCPNGAEPANCLVEPCSSPPSCQESWEYCINDYCNGECGVILLDAAGNEVTCTPV